MMLRKVVLIASAVALTACQTVYVPEQNPPKQKPVPAQSIQGKWVVESIADRGVIDFVRMTVNFKKMVKYLVLLAVIAL